MTVQQGRLDATDTTKDMENFYSDSIVDRLSDVNRILHNGTQFVRLFLTKPQPTTAFRTNISGTVTSTSTPQYIDGSFLSEPTNDVNIITIGFATSTQDIFVPTTTITLYSKSFIDPTVGQWTVSTSLNNVDAEFNNSNFDAAISSIVDSAVILDGLSQFKYVITVSAPSVDSTGAGLPYWRLKHADDGAFDSVTEVEIVEPLIPTISYFDTDGNLASSTEFDESNILDACFDTPNDLFYTIRFNSDNVGTSTITLDDDFSDADAGTASGTNNFNSGRWTESSTNNQFLRTGNQLLYNVSTGKGQLETTFSFASDFDIQLDVIPTTVPNKNSWLTMNVLDTNNNTIMSEGVGLNRTTTSGVFFASYVSNLTNSTAGCQLREIRPLWHNTSSGTDSFTILFTSGNSWTVSGTQTGAITNATTGVLYDENIESGTPTEFIISCTSDPSPGQGFTFDLTTDEVVKAATSSGIIGVARSGSNFTTDNVLTSPTAGSSATSTIELFGNTISLSNFKADNFSVTTGSGTFPNVATFTVEKTDSDGVVQGVPLIDSFDVIGDPSKTYNDFLNGEVQIACTTSGSGGGFIYLKIENQLFKYANNISLGTEDGTSAIISTTAQIPTNEVHSFNWTHESGVFGTDPFLTYIDYDVGLDLVQLKTIDKDTLLNESDTKELFLNISDYATNRYRIFFDQGDFDTLYYVDSSNNLQSWNIDDRISAFMAVNAEDVTLPAGTAQETDVNADVINAWGEVLDGKVVTFAVTAGDGAITPSSDTTVSGGRATTRFTVGSTVGVSTVTATVTET